MLKNLIKRYFKILGIIDSILIVILCRVFPDKNVFSLCSQTISYSIILFIIYGNYIWRYVPDFIKNTPYFGGRWKGNLISDYDTSKIFDANIEIKQTLFDVKVKVITNESFSETINSSFIKNGNDEKVLFYTYRNEPNANVRHRSSIHYGSVKLMLIDKETLHGNYWTDRKTTGTMKLKKINK